MGASILTCDICGYSCLKKSSLQMHIYEVHGKEENDTPVNSNAKKHRDKKVKKKAIGKGGRMTCNYCGYSCLKKSNLQMHIEAVHDKSDEGENDSPVNCNPKK